MLNTQSWLPFTQGLEIGRKRRATHDCGEGKTLTVSKDHDGYHAWCFRCGERGWVPPEQESLADKLARLARLRAMDAQLTHTSTAATGSASDYRAELPGPASYDVDSWPVAAALWFYRAGLSRADIGALGAHYHSATGRVVLPVFGEAGRVGVDQGEPRCSPQAGDAACGNDARHGVPIYWQARALDGRQPKYIGASNRPPSMIARWGSAPSPTLCEDILSAYKVGLVGEGWAVMGTSVPAAYISALLERKVTVNLWLDPDAAGRRAAAKYKKQLQAYGLQVRDIRSTLDPKRHTRAEIQEYLK